MSVIFRVYNKKTNQRFSITPEKYNIRIDSLGFVYVMKYAQDNNIIWARAQHLQVQWGMVTSGKQGHPVFIYQGDWYKDWNTGIVDIASKPRQFFMTHYQELLPQMFPMIQVLNSNKFHKVLMQIILAIGQPWFDIHSQNTMTVFIKPYQGEHEWSDIPRPCRYYIYIKAEDNVYQYKILDIASNKYVRQYQMKTDNMQQFVTQIVKLHLDWQAKYE